MPKASLSQASPRHLSWEAYLRWVDELTHYEIIDGEVCPSPTSTLRHQRVLRSLLIRLHQFVQARGLGEIFTALFDFVIQREPLRTRQPDLFFLSKAREREWQPQLNEPRLEVAPDLVVEVLSPADTYLRRKSKLQDYHALGVREVWAVDPEAEEIEVLVREESGYRSLGWFRGEQPLPTQVLTGLALTPKEVFQASEG
ncbi:MAG: Uma2 family endonuclease [Fimbriimonadales bacterium]|nr:Uma2 family endonuclease [Fimbriimonadales bacterium]MDW8051692.1 Uma2 family endonuclease [Armatimonadota bacterium]